MKFTIFLLLMFLLFTNSKIYSQSNDVRVIAGDFQKVKGDHIKVFNICVGAGSANEGLHANWQQHLAMTVKECGFRYIRFHGLLHDNMGVYSEDKNGNPIYNWQYIDALYDYLLSIGIKPFVELSFMPQALKSGEKTVFWWKANVTPPNSYDKWGLLIYNLVKHFDERYGQKEVEKWYFEVWNEPNHPGFFSGKIDEYFKLYLVTAEAVKKVSTTFRVGGPATAGTQWISETLNFCSEHHVPLDFISTHDYGAEGSGFDENGTSKQRLLKNPDKIATSIQAVHDKIASSPYPGIELHMTEWSSCYSPRDPVHDTYQNATFILNTLKKTENTATSMSYWTFTDIFEEVGIATTPFHGGFGLVNFQGIKKPSYYAYKFLNELGDTELENKDQNSWICKSKDGVQVLFWDFSFPDLRKESDQAYFVKDLPSKHIGTVNLSIENVPDGKYSCEVFKVGYGFNDVYTAYNKGFGHPTSLSPAQVTTLQQKCNGAPISTVTVKIKNGHFLKNFNINENDVCFIKLIRIKK